MSSRDSRSEYERRMHKVLEHIDPHLDEPLDLAVLAEVAHFSPFHFHRLFAAWMGETLGEYLRRRRDEVAAMRLLSQPRLPVLNAALSVGFGSGEAFSRAFKTRFGCSPSAWREQYGQGVCHRRIPPTTRADEGREQLSGSVQPVTQTKLVRRRSAPSLEQSIIV